MSEKWQLINLKLDGELAQGLRDMKLGHDESLSEVVMRLLRKVVRQAAPAPRVAPPGRSSPRAGSNPRAGSGRGALGAGKRRGKPLAPAASAEYGGAAPGQRPPRRPAPAAGARGPARGKRKHPGAAAPARFEPGPRRPGKPPRPQRRDGASGARRRDFGARTGESRPTPAQDELGTAGDGARRPRKAKGRRPSGR